jgi:hypothetical protein
MKLAIGFGAGLLVATLVTGTAFGGDKPAFTKTGCNRHVSARTNGNVVVLRFPVDPTFKKYKTKSIPYVPGKQTVRITCTTNSLSVKIL